MLLCELGRNEIAVTQPLVTDFERIKEDFIGIMPFNIFGYEVLYKKDTYGMEITIWNEFELVGYLNLDIDNSLRNFLMEPCFSDVIAKLSPKYIGKSIGLLLYRNLVTIAGLNITTHESHSVGGMKLWTAVSKDPSMSVYAFDTKVIDSAIYDGEEADVEFETIAPGLSINGKSIYDSELSLIVVKNGGKADSFIKDIIESERYRVQEIVKKHYIQNYKNGIKDNL